MKLLKALKITTFRVEYECVGWWCCRSYVPLRILRRRYVVLAVLFMSLLAFSCCEIGDRRIITPMWRIETALQEAHSETTRYVLFRDVYDYR